jgi:hypothetical protein
MTTAVLGALIAAVLAGLLARPTPQGVPVRRPKDERRGPPR